MKRIFTFFMVACSSAALMAQTLSVGTNVSDVYDGNQMKFAKHHAIFMCVYNKVRRCCFAKCINL